MVPIAPTRISSSDSGHGCQGACGAISNAAGIAVARPRGGPRLRALGPGPRPRRRPGRGLGLAGPGLGRCRSSPARDGRVNDPCGLGCAWPRRQSPGRIRLPDIAVDPNAYAEPRCPRSLRTIRPPRPESRRAPSPGRSRSASTRRPCATVCAPSPTSSCWASLSTCAAPGPASTSSSVTPRGRSPCAVWRRDWDAMLARSGETPAEGMQVVVAGGCDYYPGSATSSPGFSFSVTDLRIAGAGDLLARIDRLRKQLDSRGAARASEAPRPAAAAARTIGIVTGESGKARDDLLAALATPRLGGSSRLGLRARPGPPRRAGDHPRAGRPRRGGRGRCRDRRPRRRLAGRPALLLRRDPLPARSRC